LFLHVDSTVIHSTPAGFAGRLMRQLQNPLDQIGYCLLRFRSGTASDTTVRDEQVMVVSMQFEVHQVTDTSKNDGTVLFDTTAARMVIALLQIADWSKKQVARALETPLLTLEYRPEDLSTFESVLIRKIVENLRTQYICNLQIQSIPEGVTIRSRSGLEGITPLEWITPVGKLAISGELDGYEPIRRRIDLTTPGNHTYVLEMSRRRFYHSGFFVPTILLGGASAGCFAAERFFYDKYRHLGKSDRGQTPDRFEQTFTIAKSFETAAAVTAGLTGVSFVCCFFF
jgi:hypothetical protein